jgi:hypothetical protein
MINSSKMLLHGTPDQVRKILDDICRDLESHELARGEQWRALAIELAQRDDLNVQVVTYERQSMELEVTLPGDHGREPAIISRNKTGSHCQISLERWVDIGDEISVTGAAEFVAALLQSAAHIPLVRGADHRE